MATTATHLRRAEKEKWLSEHPSHHAWLRQRVDGKLSEWRKDPMAADMVASLKRCGNYASQTVSIDICAAMRRLALTFEPHSPPPSQRAAAEIEVILARDGVDRAQVLKKLAT
jgi:hypothetical protein